MMAEPYPQEGLDLSRAVWRTARSKGAPDEVRAPEIAVAGGMIYMRNSAEPNGEMLAFTQEEWDAFVLGVRDGDFGLT